MSTKKVSITMPDGLYERLEKVRDKFNISGICQEALDREVRIEELAMQSANDEALIERLKLQKAKRALSSQQQGRQDGINKARKLSYIQMRAFVEFKDLHFFKNEEDYAEEDTVIGLVDFITLNLSEDEEHFFGNTSLQDYFDSIRLDVSPRLDLRKFFIGFVDGVVSVYDKLKYKIGDDVEGRGLSEEGREAKLEQQFQVIYADKVPDKANAPTPVTV